MDKNKYQITTAPADAPQAGAITERGAKNGNEKNVVRRGYVGGSI